MSLSTEITNVIGSRREIPSGRDTYRRVNPARTDDLIAEYPLSDRRDLEAAVEAAERALPAWRRTPAPARGEYLRRAAAFLRANLDPIARQMAREIGKPLWEARGETEVAAKLLEFYAGEGLRAGGEQIPSHQQNAFLFSQRRPLGVVGLITPWNYPISIPAWKIGPALLCGNTAVWKPSLQHPFSTMVVVQAFEEAGLPEGVLNLVHGDGPSVGQALVDQGAVAGISFTGSRAVGEEIYRRASSRLAKASCEMGGKNPLVVLADADIARAAEMAVLGGFSYAGQKCTGTSRVIVDSKVKGDLIDALVARVGELKMGDPAEGDPFLGPVVDDRQYDRVNGLIRAGIEGGARVVCGGPDAENHAGYYIRPTVLDGIDADAPLAQTEIFGPVISLFEASGLDEAIALTNRTEYGLSASICTQRLEYAHRFVDEVESGLVYVNRPTAGAEYQAPFGGIKGSGLGPTEQGLKVLEFYSHWRTVCMQFA